MRSHSEPIALQNNGERERVMLCCDQKEFPTLSKIEVAVREALISEHGFDRFLFLDETRGEDIERTDQRGISHENYIEERC